MDTIETLLATDIESRDEAWEQQLLRALPEAKVQILKPEPQQGPDGWPYLLTATGTSNEATEPLLNVLGWLSTRGIGLVVNPLKPTPDYVLTYGMIWNFRERGEFLTASEAPKAGRFEIKNGQEVLTGPPSESYLPKYARQILKQFLMDQGVFAPKVLMVSVDKKNFDLCFSIESLKSPPAEEHAGIAEALSWFLPAHYSVSLLSEKTVPGFQNL